MLILDNVEITDSKCRRAQRNFRVQVVLLLLYDIVLLVLAAFILIFWWGETYNWGILFKSLHLIRISLLLVVLMADIEPLCIIGTGKIWKLVKFFSYYSHLGIWLVVGWVDLLITRLPLFLIDPIVLAFAGNFVSVRLLFLTILDILLIVEIPLSIHLVYTIGVRTNVYRTFIHHQKAPMTRVRILK